MKSCCFRLRRLMWITLLASLLCPVLFGQDKEKKLDPCALLTATDAASIVGAPMRIVDLAKNGCTYGEYRGRGSFVRGGVLDRELDFEVKRYKDPRAEDKEWRKAKESALDPAKKDQTQVLAGIGDEAYLVGTNDGKLTDNPGAFVSAVMYVRKGTVIFSIGILLLPLHQAVTLSADALIAAAKKIADQL